MTIREGLRWRINDRGALQNFTAEKMATEGAGLSTRSRPRRKDVTRLPILNLFFIRKIATLKRTKKTSNLVGITNIHAHCGQGQNRTGDTRLFRPLLYRLSYLSKHTQQNKQSPHHERNFGISSIFNNTRKTAGLTTEGSALTRRISHVGSRGKK